jgi:hypothetical protein
VHAGAGRQPACPGVESVLVCPSIPRDQYLGRDAGAPLRDRETEEGILPALDILSFPGERIVGNLALPGELKLPDQLVAPRIRRLPSFRPS